VRLFALLLQTIWQVVSEPGLMLTLPQVIWFVEESYTFALRWGVNSRVHPWVKCRFAVPDGGVVRSQPDHSVIGCSDTRLVLL